MRGFEPVREEFRKNTEYHLPKRSTKSSAGYDFVAPVQIILHPHEHSPIIPTDIKARMGGDEFLACHIRSSLGMKKGISLTNTTGIIDSDYYSNPDNDGNICFQLKNNSEHTVIIQKGEKVFQGIFQKYLKTDSDDTVVERIGGIGSTGESADAVLDYILDEDWRAEDFSISIKGNTLKMKCNIDGAVTRVVKCKEDTFDLEKAVMMALLKQFDINYGLVDKIIKNSPYLREGEFYCSVYLDIFNKPYVTTRRWSWEGGTRFVPSFEDNTFKTREEAEEKVKEIGDILKRK